MWEEPLVPNSAVCYGIQYELGGDRAVIIVSALVAISRGMTCGLERFNDGPGSAVMKEEDL